MKILNFGSLNVDHVYQVDHFVAAGETEHALRYDLHMGGKGMNQSVALARAGAETYHAGCIGADGVFLADFLRECGVNTRHLQQIETPTGHAMIQVDKTGQNCILLFGGANQCISDAQIDETIAQFDRGDILLLQNEINGLDRIMRCAAARGMRIALNPSPATDALMQLPLELVEWLILNEVEGEQLSGETNPDRILAALRSRWPRCRVVLTLGKRGVRYADDAVQCAHGIYPVQVVDTTGAGDTFTGYFLAAVAQGKPVPDALRTASRASSIGITRPGAAQSIPTADEVENAQLPDPTAG